MVLSFGQLINCQAWRAKNTVKVMKFLLLLTCLSFISAKSEDSRMCPTWFHSTQSSSYCECGSSLNGAIDCDNVTKQVSITLEYCMTLSNVSGEVQLVAARTNNVFIGRSPRGFTVLPDNVSDLNDFMCTNSSRRGFLCGDCISGYGYAPNSYSKKCAKCNAAYAVGIFLVFGILPMTVCFVLIVVLHLNFPSGVLFPYIVFCQCYIAAVKAYSGMFSTMGSSMGPFGQFNLNLCIVLSGLSQYFIGVYYIITPVCLHQTLSELQVLCLEYIICLYPLFLIILTSVFIELHARNCRLVMLVAKVFRPFLSCVDRNWSVSDSIIHAYATFYFLAFFYLIFLSYSVLYAVDVYVINGEKIKTVLVYDTSIEWFSTSHLPYAIPAIVILVVFGVCPTLILCLESNRKLTRCLKLRTRIQLILNTFVETFSSCYKDGLNDTYDYRFFTSLPMITGFFLFFLFPSYNFKLRLYFHFIFSLLFLLLAFIFAYLRPFKSMYMNVTTSINTSIISVLTIIATFWFEGHAMSDIVLASSFTFFSLFPHIVVISTIIFKFLNLISSVRMKIDIAVEMWLSLFRRSSDNEMVSSASALPHRLENSNVYQQL